MLHRGGTFFLMKKSRFFFYLLFFYVFLFIVLPPILSQFFLKGSSVTIGKYPLSTFILAFISILIYLFSRKGLVFEEKFESKKLAFFQYSASAMTTFGILCLSSVIFESLSYFFKMDSGIANVLFPKSFWQTINFILGVICAALFEEIIYRFYLPLAFKELFIKSKFYNNPKLSVITEFIAILLFALPHLYLGFLGFLNALVCGFALRMCMIKTRSLWICLAVHGAYNFFALGLMALIG